MAYSVPIASVVAGSPFAITTASIDTTGADLIVIVMSNLASGGDPTPSDNKSNSWTLAAGLNDGSSRRIAIFYSSPTSVGSGHTFTNPGAISALVVTAWQGSVSSPKDQNSSGASANASSIATGSLTPTETNELVIAAAMCEGASNPAFTGIDGGFATPIQLTGVSGTYNCAQSYLIQTSAAAANPTWTLATSQNANAIAASFKDTPGGSTVKQLAALGVG